MAKRQSKKTKPHTHDPDWNSASFAEGNSDGIYDVACKICRLNGSFKVTAEMVYWDELREVTNEG